MRNVCAHLVIHRIVATLLRLSAYVRSHPTPYTSEYSVYHTEFTLQMVCSFFGMAEVNTISNLLLSLRFESYSWSQSYFLSQCCEYKNNMISTLYFLLLPLIMKKKRCHLCIYNLFFCHFDFQRKGILKLSVNQRNWTISFNSLLMIKCKNLRPEKITNKIWKFCRIPLSKIATFWSNEHAQWAIYISDQHQRYVFYYMWVCTNRELHLVEREREWEKVVKFYFEWTKDFSLRFNAFDQKWFDNNDCIVCLFLYECKHFNENEQQVCVCF